MTEQENSGLLLSGLDGANPLAFLAALGTLRGLTLAWPDRRVCLSWTLRDTWRPILHVDGGTLSKDEALDGLERFMEMRPGHEALRIGLLIEEPPTHLSPLPKGCGQCKTGPFDDLKMSPDWFRWLAADAAYSASPENRARADFMAAFANDTILLNDRGNSKGKGKFVDSTQLQLCNGAGHKHFLSSMRYLAEKVTRDKIQHCLFNTWTRGDERLSLLWDPEDDRRHALQWQAPTNEVTRTEWGANRLAFEAMPLFPVTPKGRRRVTTGFSEINRQTTWTWPMWDVPISIDVVKSLVALSELQNLTLAPTEQNKLDSMGIKQVFRCRRVYGEKGRISLSPASPV